MPLYPSLSLHCLSLPLSLLLLRTSPEPFRNEKASRVNFVKCDCTLNINDCRPLCHAPALSTLPLARTLYSGRQSVCFALDYGRDDQRRRTTLNVNAQRGKGNTSSSGSDRGRGSKRQRGKKDNRSHKSNKVGHTHTYSGTHTQTLQ